MYRDMDFKRLEELSRPGDASEKAVGLRLAAALRVANLKQAELARMIGKTQGAIGNAVRGENYPSVDAMQVLYRVARIDFNFLLMGQTPQLPGDVQMNLLFALEAVQSERDRKSSSD
jgi:transcriptional regulator with XRE-family HTH domain